AGGVDSLCPKGGVEQDLENWMIAGVAFRADFRSEFGEGAFSMGQARPRFSLDVRQQLQTRTIGLRINANHHPLLLMAQGVDLVRRVQVVDADHYVVLPRVPVQ